MTDNETFSKLTNAVVTQNIAGCAQLTQEAQNAGIPALDIITKGLSPGMKILEISSKLQRSFCPRS